MSLHTESRICLQGTESNIHQELIQRCLQGDRQAYYSLYKLYKKGMYSVGLRIVNNTEEAEDVLQEAFISAFKNLDHYRGESSFGSWLKQIVVNKAINQVKKRKPERLPEDEQFDVMDEVTDDELEGYPFTIEKVKRAIAMLPDGYRTVVSLYLVEGYDHGEIAEILGISESTSKSQFNRSKKRIKEILENA